ncbi:MAG: hypothetical protein K6G10_01580 [Butyrivibrio sp.]|nr:hypothetical protein [Butyrivibrio sp.]
MSMGTEAALEADMDEYIRYMNIERDAENGFWTMKNGERIHVSKMTEGHIRNTIALLEKNNARDLYLPWICRLEKELNDRMEVVR